MFHKDNKLMTQHEREMLVNRICAGYIRYRNPTTNISYRIQSPSIHDKYVASEIFEESYGDALLKGAMSDEQISAFMEKNGIWNRAKELIFEGIQSDIEEIKLGLYNNILKSNEIKAMKQKLVEARNRLNQLYTERHSYDQYSARGIAELNKNRYLVARSIYSDGAPIFTESNYWMSNIKIISDVMEHINKNRITETQFRELARLDPWRQIWTIASSPTDIFSYSISSFSDDQKYLCYWSKIYDSIYENSERPPDDIIEDDDILDGWMIHQRRKNSKETDKAFVEKRITNSKIRNSDEVFVVVDTIEDAKRVENANDAVAASLKRQRLKHLNKKGEVSEGEMPDVKLNLNMLRNNLIKEKIRNQG